MDYNSRPNSVDSFQQNNHFYHHSSPQQNNVQPMSIPSGGIPPTIPDQQMVYPAGQQMPQSMDYMNQYTNQYTLYVQQYYREYYRQWLQQHNRQHPSSSSLSSQTSAPTLKQPLKYGSHRCHARAVFSQHNNNVMILDNSSTTGRHVLMYCLNDLFIDYLFENQLFHLLLRNERQLPFDCRENALQWIRCKQQSFELNFELKLILRVIQMILKQNSRITGLDLSELLFDLIDSKVLNKSFIYSENEFKNNSLNTFRELLMRGQKTLALNHALSSGLMEHALILSYLMDEEKRSSDDLMLKTIRKFCETMSSSDPIFVFYNSILNSIQKKNNFLELSFESFLILLSNEMSLTSVVVKSQEFKHLLTFIKSLMNSKTEEFLLNEELFDSEMDSILIQECLEFSLFSGKRFNKKLIEKKTKFVSILFDFGFASNALKYCQQLKPFCDSSSETTTGRLVSQIESRFDQNISFKDDDNLSFQQQEEETTADNETTPEETLKESIPQYSSEESVVQPPPPPQVPQSIAPPVRPLPPPPVQSVGPFSPPISAINSLDSQMTSPPMIPMNESLNEEIPFSFVSSSQSLPSMPFNVNEFSETETTLTDDNRQQQQQVKTTTVDDNRSSIETKSNNNSGFLSKLLPFNFKAKNQAILPDDSKMTLKFDKNTNQWIDTSVQQNGAIGGQAPQRAPPVGPPTLSGQPLGGNKFGFRSQRRYIDITKQ